MAEPHTAVINSAILLRRDKVRVVGCSPPAPEPPPNNGKTGQGRPAPRLPRAESGDPGRRTHAGLDPECPPPRNSSMAPAGFSGAAVLAGAFQFGTACEGLRLNSSSHVRHLPQKHSPFVFFYWRGMANRPSYGSICITDGRTPPLVFLSLVFLVVGVAGANEANEAVAPSGGGTLPSVGW